jgi:hypothetical protein
VPHPSADNFTTHSHLVQILILSILNRSGPAQLKLPAPRCSPALAGFQVRKRSILLPFAHQLRQQDFGEISRVAAGNALAIPFQSRHFFVRIDYEGTFGIDNFIKNI